MENGRDRRSVLALGLATAALAAPGAAAMVAETQDEVRAFFGRFVAAQNARDTEAAGTVLLDAPDFLWITPRGEAQ